MIYYYQKKKSVKNKTKKKIKTPKSFKYKAPKHEWEGSLIRFEESPGKWGKWVDLRGEKGNSVGGGVTRNIVGRTEITDMINSLTTGSGQGAAFGPGPISQLSETTNSFGTSTFATRQDHIHFHGNLTGSELHNLADFIQSGFMSYQDKISQSMLPTSFSLISQGGITYVIYDNFV